MYTSHAPPPSLTAGAVPRHARGDILFTLNLSIMEQKNYNEDLQERKANMTRNFTQESYEDRYAADYFAALDVDELEFTPKLAGVTEKNPTETIVINVAGRCHDDDPLLAGLRLNFDVWSKNDCTDEDKAVFFNEDGTPKGNIADIILRYGTFKGVDPSTGEEKTVVAKHPKWHKVLIDGKWITLSGDKREYRGDAE